MLGNSRKARKELKWKPKTKIKNLCLSGGVALNGLMNNKILNSNNFLSNNEHNNINKIIKDLEIKFEFKLSNYKKK